jgi:hypothetical protein
LAKKGKARREEGGWGKARREGGVRREDEGDGREEWQEDEGVGKKGNGGRGESYADMNLC